MGLVILLTISQAFSSTPVDDKQDLAALVNGFATAMVKKDKVWMNANFASTVVTQTPTGESLDKALTIRAFSGEIYDITKSVAFNQSFTVTGTDAVGSSDYTVEGVAKMGTDIIDVAGPYRLSFKFRKVDNVWQISKITIHGN